MTRRKLPDGPAIGTVSATALLQGDSSFAQEYRCLDRNNRIVWIHEEVSLEKTGPGTWNAFGVCTNITQRKQMEDALRTSEERFTLFLKNFPGPAFVKDSEGHIIFVNDAHRSI